MFRRVAIFLAVSFNLALAGLLSEPAGAAPSNACAVNELYENNDLELTFSRDAAVRGHRLFGVDELDEVVLHPPIQRFLTRWRPGDPAVYLGALWVP